MASSPPAKPPITCHILDTTIGRPAPNIPVTLTLHNPAPSTSTSTSTPLTFTSLTNADGRVTSWTPQTPTEPQSTPHSLETVFARSDGGDQKYSLLFDTEAYFGERGIEAFFPEVQVRFVVRERQRLGAEGKGAEHFHVPVLLGPFGFTTYRGS